MRILVENKPAVVKKGTKIDFIAENRRFTGADAYTLNITFPLKDCPKNRSIFGHIDRIDVEKQLVRYDAEIFAGRLHSTGVLTPTEVNETSVKCQFLEGKSVQNFGTDLDDKFINELDLGGPSHTYINTETDTWGGSHEHLWSVDKTTHVYLPWVNDATGNLQNSNVTKTGLTTGELSAQPYLLYIAEAVCDAVGFSHDFSAWRAHDKWKHLIVCNTLPHAWEQPDFRYAMPAWSVTEFFEELEKLMDCEIDIDYVSKKVTLTYSEDYYSSFPDVTIDRVLNEYTATVTQDIETDFRDAVNIGYAEVERSIQPFYSCHWFVTNRTPTRIYPDLYEMWDLETGGQLDRVNGCKGLMYVEDENRYFIWRYSSDGYTVNPENDTFRYIPQEVNQFGPLMNDPSTDDIKKTLNIVPVTIDQLDYYRYAMFVNPGEYQEEEQTTDRAIFWAQAKIVDGEVEHSSSSYDKIFVAFWRGTNNLPNNNMFCPFTDSLMFVGGGGGVTEVFDRPPYSLKLTEQTQLYPIYANTKYTISFLSETFPDPRSVFHIRGRKFVCAKLTATITEDGMSEKIKGEFYLMKDADGRQ